MHDRDIFFFGIQVCLLVARIGVAFFRDNETGSHLDTCAAKRQIVEDILVGVDASGKDNGDGTGVFFFVAMYDLQNFPDFVIVAARGCLFYGFGGVAEMASGCRTFDDNEIRNAVIVIVPKLQKNLGSPGRGNDRGELDGASLCVFWQIGRETGSGDDEIGSVFDAAADVFLVVGQGAHDIDADDAAV